MCLVELRHEESTATLRPKKANVSRPASPASSIASFESKHPSQHAYSDNNHASSSNKPWERSKSPELPTFHFTRPSYSGTNFRAELGGGEEVPPVPALPLAFLGKPPAVQMDAQESDDILTANLRRTAFSSQPTSMHRSKQAVADSSRTSNDDSGGSSLVHVEHALDLSEEYSLISATTDVRRQSGKLPWRRSVQGVFVWKGENEARREGHSSELPAATAPEKRPSCKSIISAEDHRLTTLPIWF